MKEFVHDLFASFSINVSYDLQRERYMQRYI